VSSIIIRMSAIRKLAAEAADNGLLAPELAQGISRVKSVKSTGIRVGNWLSQRQAQMLLSAPDIATVSGLRDLAILAVLLGCGLRRSEVAALTFTHVQQRDGRWCIVDLVGKHGRVRTAPMPAWVKVAIDAWTSGPAVAAGIVRRVCIFDATREEGEAAKEAVRNALAALPIGAAPKQLAEAEETALTPYKAAVATRKQKARLESEKQAQRRAVAWRADLQLFHITRHLEQEYDFDGGYLEMCREADRLRPLIREALIDELMENPNMSDDHIRKSIEDQIEDGA
jgi:integrase